METQCCGKSYRRDLWLQRPCNTEAISVRPLVPTSSLCLPLSGASLRFRGFFLIQGHLQQVAALAGLCTREEKGPLCQVCMLQPGIPTALEIGIRYLIYKHIFIFNVFLCVIQNIIVFIYIIQQYDVLLCLYYKYDIGYYMQYIPYSIVIEYSTTNTYANIYVCLYL